MAMRHSQTMHDFWYQRDKSHRYQSVSYVGKHFFSYNTEIGALIVIDGRDYGLVAEYHFSNTTANHLSKLRYACPVEYVEVPFDWRDDFTGVSQAKMLQVLRKRFIAEIRERSLKSFSKRTRAAREECDELLRRFAKFMHIIGKEYSESEYNVTQKLVEQILETPENLELWKAERQKIAKATAKKNAKAKKERVKRERKENKTRAAVRKWLEMTKPSLKELINARYQSTFTMPENADQDSFWELYRIGNIKTGDWESAVLNSELSKALEKAVEPEMPVLGVGYYGSEYRECPSFVWRSQRNPETLETSQGVKFPVKDARVLYKAWKAGRLVEGMHVGPYILRQIGDTFMRIGCHCIPMQNIELIGEMVEA